MQEDFSLSLARTVVRLRLSLVRPAHWGSVSAMAANIRKKFNSDYSIAVSGIAGPEGGTVDKPVGTVWLAIGHPNGMFTKKLQLGNFRERVIIETSLHALNNLRKILTGEIK